MIERQQPANECSTAKESSFQSETSLNHRLSKEVSTKSKPIKKSRKQITQCEHTDSEFYAQGLCSKCYHNRGRVKKAKYCEHIDLTMYARGVCKSCYHQFFFRRKITRKSNKKNVIWSNLCSALDRKKWMSLQLCIDSTRFRSVARLSLRWARVMTRPSSYKILRYLAWKRDVKLHP
jgi:hypothetical protein